MKKLRIFISSPGDVGRERDSAARVIARLRAELAGRVDLDPYFWEHEPMQAGADFQAQIPPPSEFSIFIGILWSRLGTRLNRKHTRPPPDGRVYESGTAFEFETALAAYRASAEKTPRILIYRRTEIPSFPVEPGDLRRAREAQWEALKTFVADCFTDVLDGGTFTAGFNEYGNTADFEEKLEAHLRIVCHELAPDTAGADPGGAPPPTWVKGSPYRGLEVFQFEHAPLFFGRTRESDSIVGLLRDRANEEATPFVLIFGGSGSGKSSLLRAGVLPLLVAGGADGIGIWRRALLQPSQGGGDLFDGLAAALLDDDAMPELAAGGRTPAQLSALLRENAAGVGAMIATALPLVAQRQHEAAQAQLRDQAAQYENEGRPADAEPVWQLLEALRFPTPRLILALDQLEEMFTHEDRFPPANRTAFIHAIVSLVQSGYVWVAATLRSDFFTRCEELPELMQLKAGRGQVHLLPPEPAQLRQMIRLPAQAAGVRFEDDPQRGRLDDVLHDAAMHEPGSLPLLSFALDQLFTLGSADRVLTHAEYEQLGGGEGGGLRGVLVKMADEIYGRLSPAALERFLPVFRRLVTIAPQAGSEERFSRRSTPRASVTGDSGEKEVVGAFLAARLFVADADAGGEEIISVAHEALLNEWPKLRELLQHERGWLRMRARLATAAAEWEDEDRRPQRLAQGVALAEAREIEAAEGRSLTPSEREFVSLSRRKDQQRMMQWLAGAAAAVVLFAGLAVWAFVARQEATRQRRHAEQLLAASLFARAQQLFGKDEAPGAIAVLADAIKLNPDEASEAGERLWFALTQRAWALPLAPEIAHHGAIMTASFSADGQRVVTASADQTAQLWDAATGASIGLPLPHDRLVREAWFSPSGRQIVTACDDAKARLWEPGKTQPIAIFAHQDAISVVAFGPGGRVVATGSRDKSAGVWDIAANRRVADLPHGNSVHALAFHPSDQSLLLTVSGRVARLWKWTENRQIFELAYAKGAEVKVARFDATGSRIVTGGNGGIVRVWDAATGQPSGPALATETLDSGSVSDALFSPDGTLIAACAGNRAFVWKTDGTLASGSPLVCRDGVLTLRFSPGGQRLLTGSDDGRAQLWDARTGAKIGEAIRATGAIVAADFTADGSRLLIASRSGVARVWQPPASAPACARWPQTAGIEALRLSPDGHMLLAACGDGKVRRWDIGRHALLEPAITQPDGALCAAFSPDGKYIVSAGVDRTARVWQADSGKAAGKSPQLDNEVRRVEFGPEPTKIFATATLNATQLWTLPDMTSRGQIVHEAQVTAVAFNGNGSLLLTTCEDSTARLSSTKDGGLKLAPLKGNGVATCGLFAGDKFDKFVVGASDGTVQIRDLAGRAIFDPLRHKDAIVALARSGDRLATASRDHTAALWSIATGRSTGDTMEHGGAVTAIAFSPDGTRVATGCDDGSARLWSAAGGQPLSEWLWHPDAVSAVVFSPDGRTLFCASGNEVRSWTIAAGLGTADRRYLASLAHALATARQDPSGRMTPHVPDVLAELRKIDAPSKPAATLRDWLFADVRLRAITPFSTTTVPALVDACLVEGTETALDEALLFTEGDAAQRTRIEARRSAPPAP